MHVYKIFEKNRFFVLKFWQNRGVEKITPGDYFRENMVIDFLDDKKLYFAKKTY